MHLHAAVAAGTVIISFANVAGGQSLLYPLLYSWAALYAFYFFPMRAALVHLAFIGACYAAVLVHQDGPLVRWPLAVGTPAVAGVLMSRLLSSLRRQAASTEERASELRQSEARTRLLLDSAPDAFVAIDASTGAVVTWNKAAERLFGWTAAEAIGTPLRALIFPEEGRGAHDDRRQELLGRSDAPIVVQLEVDLQRKDGTVFAAEETIHRLVVGDDVVLSAFIRDLTERRRRQQEREVLLSEQAARAEAERVAEMVSGMQLVVDAALAHRTTRDILPDLVSRVRGVLGADGASIYLAEDDGLALRAASGSPNGSDPGAAAARRGLRRARGGHPRAHPEPGRRSRPGRRLAGGGAPARRRQRDRRAARVRRRPAPVQRRRPLAAPAGRRPRGTRDRPRPGLRARAPDRGDAPAEPAARPAAPRCPGSRWPPATCPPPRRPRWAGDWYDVIPMTGGRVGLVMGDVAGKGLAAASMVGRLRSALRAYALEGHDPAVAVDQLNRLMWSEARGQPDGHPPVHGRGPGEGTM